MQGFRDSEGRHPWGDPRGHLRLKKSLNLRGSFESDLRGLCSRLVP